MSPSRILIGTDFSDEAKFALEEALRRADEDQPVELHVVSVVDDSGHHLLPDRDRHTTLSQVVDRVRQLLIASVGSAVERQAPLRRTALLPPVIHVRLGNVAEQIAELATEIRADLIVVGRRGHRGHRHYAGSVAERILRLAPCPVLVVRPKDFSAMNRVPQIDPACPACLQARERSHGEHWWCPVHETERERAHVYSFSGRLTDPHPPRDHML